MSGRIVLLLVVILAIAALFIFRMEYRPSSMMESGRADIVPIQTGLNSKGTVRLRATKEGLKIEASLEGLPPGKHGFHIHEYGDLGNEGKNAGGHYNPADTPHGFVLKDGVLKAHAGDLGNIEVDENGNATLEMTIPELTLNGGRYNVAGRSFIIHEKEDDFGQPTGNAGGRIAGGVIIVVGP